MSNEAPDAVRAPDRDRGEYARLEGASPRVEPFESKDSPPTEKRRWNVDMNMDCRSDGMMESCCSVPTRESAPPEYKAEERTFFSEIEVTRLAAELSNDR